ncbi:hypothetical protein MHI37_05835 [Paenibacillus sp. FSL H8-0548]|uniref:hypothetical protein n=1 Tax=Paenibacillus sp. FSL H8-0548 TaxID=1920422 RepID=UPI00117F54D6|nr:hypothetical protein [Paenibacillus sp. FSL H8-0548]
MNTGMILVLFILLVIIASSCGILSRNESREDTRNERNDKRANQADERNNNNVNTRNYNGCY